MDETFVDKNLVGGPGFSISNNDTENEFSLESPKKANQLDKSRFIDEAVLHLTEQGLDVDAHNLDLSGKLTRCPLIGKPKGNKDCAYIIHTDDPACVWYQNYPSGVSGTWIFPSGPGSKMMSDQERRALQEQIAINRQNRLAEKAQIHAAAAIVANKAYNEASSDTDQVNRHAYAVLKRVEFGPEVRLGSWPQRSWQEAILIPTFNQAGELTSLQAINSSGDKDFLFGGKIAGSYCTIGSSFLSAKRICVVEGYVTGAAVHSATGLPVVVAFGAGNLLAVGQIVRKFAPEAEIVFCADDDQKPDKNQNPGIHAATLAARAVNGKLTAPGLGKKADFWDFWHELGCEALKNAIDNALSVGIETQGDYDFCQDDDQVLELDTLQKPVGQLCPRVSFPWQVLPPRIETTLKQLARSCATSAQPMPGLAFCMMSAAVGRNFSVSAKASWKEPSIIWSADIRESGAGKTPAMSELSNVFRLLQSNEKKRIRDEQKASKRLSTEEKKEMEPLGRPRRYYSTSLTLEGLHAELAEHPTGGLLVPMSELSALFNSQGEYKGGRGTDREGYLALHDGKGASITRKAETIDIEPAAVQFCGGIQPMIFSQLFSKKSGTYLVDGTIFRFLLTYEAPSFFPLTSESWTEENKLAWNQTLLNAFEWADNSAPMIAVLSQEAQARFISWRNEIGQQLPTLPELFRGFIPKAWGYALRLAGVLHLLERFSDGLEPEPILSLRDIERGIIAVEFYLGQTLDAIRLIVSPDQPAPVEASKESFVLARSLDQLRNKTDKNMLAVGFITETYNELSDKEGKVTPRKLGELLRKCGLSTTNTKHDANELKRAKCLKWSNEVELFIKTSLASQARELDHQQRLSVLGEATDRNLPSVLHAQSERISKLENEATSTSDSDRCSITSNFPDEWDPDASVHTPNRKREVPLNESREMLPFGLSNYREQ